MAPVYEQRKKSVFGTSYGKQLFEKFISRTIGRRVHSKSAWEKRFTQTGRRRYNIFSDEGRNRMNERFLKEAFLKVRDQGGCQMNHYKGTTILCVAFICLSHPPVHLAKLVYLCLFIIIFVYFRKYVNPGRKRQCSFRWLNKREKSTNSQIVKSAWSKGELFWEKLSFHQIPSL